MMMRSIHSRGQVDQANFPGTVFMASDLLNNESGSGLNTSGTFSTPEPPGKAQRAENGAVAIPVRKPEAIVSESTRLHRNDLRRSRDERSNAEISRSSLRSESMLEKHAELCRARDLAKMRRERIEAEAQAKRAQKEEMEIEHEIAALSASHRSSKASERSTPRSRSAVRPEVPIIDLTEGNLRQHDARSFQEH